MTWVLIALVSGSLLTSTHDSKEACMGRVGTLADQKIGAKCVEAPTPFGTSSLSITGNGIYYSR